MWRNVVALGLALASGLAGLPAAADPPAAPPRVGAISPAVDDGERSPGRIKYDVRLRADDAAGTSWTGRQRVSFTNTSREPLPEVYLRLWGNTWDGCASPVMLTRFTGGTAAAPSVNCTAVKITLDRPLLPGRRTTVGFDLALTAPERAERFGRSGAYRFFGNALPVLAVRDQGGWHLEPNVGIGESHYTLSADFRVRFDHPAGISVPATGTTVRGRRSTISLARQMRDFAWAAGPFKRTTTVSPGGTKINTWWTDVVTPGAVADARTKGTAAIDDFSRRFGKYPYGEIDLVLNDNWKSFFGMEYPGFLLLVAPPDEEGPVVHELAHQWWYNIVGNNKYADPWLGESLAVYASDLHWGDNAEDCWPGDLDHAITNDMAYWKRHGSGWTLYVYFYGACMLHDLERVIGEEAMAKMLRTYARNHWYGVATPESFKSTAQAATTTDLTDFWRSHRIS